MRSKSCEYCGKKFFFRSHGDKRNKNIKFCSKNCYGEYLKGKPSHSLGKYWSEESKNKIKGNSPWNKGKKCPKISEAMGGKFNPSWKGGISKLQNTIRSSDKYSNWRTQVFGRDNFTCQECGKRGSWLEAHHIKRFTDILKENNIQIFQHAMDCNELWDLNNGVTLCKECHNLLKKKV